MKNFSLSWVGLSFLVLSVQTVQAECLLLNIPEKLTLREMLATNATAIDLRLLVIMDAYRTALDNKNHSESDEGEPSSRPHEPHFPEQPFLRR